jgi:hypothetical protein
VGDSAGATGAAGGLTGGVAASSVGGPAGRTGAPTGAAGGGGAGGRSCSSEVGPLTGASGAATGAGGGVAGGGARLLSVGSGVEGTAIAGLPAAPVGACVTTGDSGAAFASGRDCGTGFEPAGHRDESSTNCPVFFELLTGARGVESSGDGAAFVELPTGQRDVALSAERRVFTELSTGERDVAFADGGITPSPLGPTSTLSPTFVFDVGCTGFAGAAAAARSRAVFAAGLSASNRGGSVGRLT